MNDTAVKTNNNAPINERPLKKKSQWLEIWKRFKKNRTAMLGLVIFIVLILTAIFADAIVPYSKATDLVLKDANQLPSSAHWFGTDNLGRDIFARIVHGSRVSLQVGIVCVTVCLLIGVALGAIAGFYGGFTDNVIMRALDILMAIPSILLAIAIVAALGTSLTNLIIAIAIGYIPAYARITRAAVLTIREQEFVEAARAIGGNDFRLIMRHILPNCMAPLIVQATMNMGAAILSAAGLSFIGLGAPPPTPEWGQMLSEGRRFIRDYWHPVFFPGVSIALVVFGLNMLGDGLRDALDPRLKK